MPGLRMYHPDPIDADWVRAGLLELGTLCEWWKCTNQATCAYEGRKTVAFVCEMHTLELDERPHVGRELEGFLWDRFQEGFNFINQVHASGGKLLDDIDALDREIKANARKVITETKQAETQARKIMATALKQGKIGAPDDDLAEARGIQSLARDPFQVVFRVPEPAPPKPVTLPQYIEPSPLIGGLLF